jgi:putative membrane protein
MESIMIVRDRPSGLRLFLTMRGSILGRIWKSLLVTTLLAVAVTWSGGALLHQKITLTTLPFTLIGLPLAIFLGFRSSSAYDRYWEGRKLWGDVVLRSRTLARQCLSLIDTGQPVAVALTDVRARMIYRTIGFAHALRHHLRDTDAAGDLKPLLRDREWQDVQRASNKPHFLMIQMGADLGDCIRAGQVDSCLAASMDAGMTGMVGAGAACERIKTTPIPFSYTLLLHRTSYMYCFLLPFGLVDTIGVLTPFVVAIVAYTFFGLDALGDEIEEPFGTSANDLALDAVCRTIEIDLREALGDPDVPAPLAPVDHLLT